MGSILFCDKLKAFHLEDVLEEDGSTRQKVSDSPFVDDLPCQISFDTDDKATPKAREHIPQERPLKIFILMATIPKNQMFKRGDRIKAIRGDGVGVYEGIIGEPRIYTRGIAHVELSFEG